MTDYPVYSHLYTLLVAPPGTGKGEAIKHVEHFWRKVKGKTTGRLKLAPRSMTRASMVDEMVKSQKRIPLNRFPGFERNSVDLVEYSSLLILAEELGVLISSHDLEFLSILTELYNTGPAYTETRRTGKLDLTVINPQVVFLGGAQPSFLASILPEEAWGMGAMSRIIMIYSGQQVRKDLWPSLDAEQTLKMKALRASMEFDMTQMLDLHGQFTWSIDAARAVSDWDKEGNQPEPAHSKLTHYNRRRTLHSLRLSMIAAISRGNDLHVTLADFVRARDWMLEAELRMPDIFRDMVGKSDSQIITELHFAMYQQWKRLDMQGIHESFLYHFLNARAPSERIPRIIEVAEKSGVIARLAGTELWVPRPKNQHGME